MQFLSPEGTPKQAAVQYIQLLRPLMMIPGSQYSQPMKSNPTYEPEMKAMHYGPPANLNPMFEPEFRMSQYSQSLNSNPIQINEPEIRTTLPISSSPKPKFEPSFSPFSPYQYQRQPMVGAYSSPQSSYFQTNPLLFEEPMEKSQPDTGLNMNEYIPFASSQHASMVLAPRSSMMSALSPFAYKPKPHKQLSQRAKK